MKHFMHILTHLTKHETLQTRSFKFIYTDRSTLLYGLPGLSRPQKIQELLHKRRQYVNQLSFDLN